MTTSKELYSLLKENYVYDLFFTHVSLIQPKGKYSLSRSVLSKFWDLYCKIVSLEEPIDLGIAECQQAYSAVLVDIDFKFKLTEYLSEFDSRFYTLEFVQKLIHIYQDVLKEVIDIPDVSLLTCVLLEKPPYKIEDGTEDECFHYKNGFHLHFPKLFISRINQEVVIIPKVRQKMSENYYDILTEYNKFSSKLVETKKINELIDTAALRNAWLLYGSKKSIEQKPYTITEIYDNSLNELKLEDAFRDYQLFDENEEPIELHNSNIIFYLPRILSVCPYGRSIYEIKSSIQNPIQLLNFIEKPKFVESNDLRDDEEIKSDMESLQKIIPLLDKKRADDRNDWMTVGWAIFNISQGSDEGLDTWINFSKQSFKFNEASCIYEWSHMEDRKKITIGTLKYFAKQDNPEKYNCYLKEMAKTVMKKEIKGSHFDLAILLHSQYGNEYVYSVSGWFRFINHHWEHINDGTELRSKISKDLVEFFTVMRSEVYSEMSKVSNESDLEKLKAKDKDISRLISCLKNTPFKNNVMKECQEVFHIRDFETKLNTNRYLIGFSNGVYDLENNIFRPGLPIDYISIQMPIPYKDFSENDSKVRDVFGFLEKVFPDTLLRRYFLDVMCETFVGYNHRKQVYFWTGEGDNGKSITQMFFEKMFGRLSIKAPTSLITSKRPNAGSANAELARAGNGVRTIFLEEPDPDEEIFTGVFKHLSGNDSIYTRDLYQAGKNVTEIIPMFRLFVICNKLPKIRKGGDKATWNRIRVIPFESTFSKTAPVTVEEQLHSKTFPVDPNFAQKIQFLVEPFAWILLQHRTKPKIDDPDKVIAATDRYRMNNDYIHQFLSQTVVDDETGKVSIGDLYSKYKDWLIEGLPGVKPIPLLDYTEYLAKKWGEPDPSSCWKGKKFRYEQTTQSNNAGDIL